MSNVIEEYKQAKADLDKVSFQRDQLKDELSKIKTEIKTALTSLGFDKMVDLDAATVDLEGKIGDATANAKLFLDGLVSPVVKESFGIDTPDPSPLVASVQDPADSADFGGDF